PAGRPGGEDSRPRRATARPGVTQESWTCAQHVAKLLGEGAEALRTGLLQLKSFRSFSNGLPKLGRIRPVFELGEPLQKPLGPVVWLPASFRQRFDVDSRRILPTNQGDVQLEFLGNPVRHAQGPRLNRLDR